MIRADISMPESLLIEAEPFSLHWRMVKETQPGEIEQKLQEAGWRSERSPTEVVAAGIARDAVQAWQEAIEDLSACTLERGVNAVEIRQVRMKKIGWLCYAMIEGHPWRLEAAPGLLASQETAKHQAA